MTNGRRRWRRLLVLGGLVGALFGYREYRFGRQPAPPDGR